MRTFEQHEAFEMKPRKLTIEEVEDPETVINELFQIAHLPELRWYLWESTKTLVTGSFHQLRPNERQNLIFFHEQIERLIEASHVLYERRKARSGLVA